MKSLTPFQESIVKFIRDNPDCKIGDIATAINAPWKEVQRNIDLLEYSGVYIGEDDNKFVLIGDER